MNFCLGNWTVKGAIMSGKAGFEEIITSCNSEAAKAVIFEAHSAWFVPASKIVMLTFFSSSTFELYYSTAEVTPCASILYIGLSAMIPGTKTATDIVSFSFFLLHPVKIKSRERKNAMGKKNFLFFILASLRVKIKLNLWKYLFNNSQIQF